MKKNNNNIPMQRNVGICWYSLIQGHVTWNDLLIIVLFHETMHLVHDQLKAEDFINAYASNSNDLNGESLVKSSPLTLAGVEKIDPQKQRSEASGRTCALDNLEDVSTVMIWRGFIVSSGQDFIKCYF